MEPLASSPSREEVSLTTLLNPDMAKVPLLDATHGIDPDVSPDGEAMGRADL
jgi:hypothetical protein